MKTRLVKTAYLFALTIVTITFVGFNPYFDDSGSTDNLSQPGPENSAARLRDISHYRPALRSVDSLRIKISEDYAEGEKAVQQCVEASRSLLITAMTDSIIPFWYGTRWDFNGTTETPRRGKIACGYFVTTVLRDAGLKVERVKLAQQASEIIIRSLTTEDHINRFRNVPFEDFLAALLEEGDGLYIVGLDIHVGFLHVRDKDARFIHSAYSPPYRVVNEPAHASFILEDSRYRVIGKISADDRLLLKWLNETEIPTL